MKQEHSSAKSSAKDVFSYLLMIIMLYVGVISFIAVLWQYINVRLPDPLQFYYSGATEIIRTSISSLLIVWPVLIFVTWLIARDIRHEHDKRDVWIRKWLLYLTLFIASLTIIIDLINLTNSFLGGELTMRFALKVLVVLVVAAAVFSYYLWDLRRDPVKTTKVTRFAAAGSVLVILVAIVMGFFVVGSPSQQRARRMDEQRVSDLSSIQGQILNHWVQKGTLPADLEALKDPLYGYEAPLDPATNQPYELAVRGELNFTLCATFDTAYDPSAGATDRYYYESPVYPVGGKGMDIWTHDQGRTCFERTIDPLLYRQEEPLPVK
ncbi:hypothetical protein KKG19_03045 [Patescibacteria group bacterium]|nr:hypothetical protein [Patescibacteria group bacterium]